MQDLLPTYTLTTRDGADTEAVALLIDTALRHIDRITYRRTNTDNPAQTCQGIAYGIARRIGRRYGLTTEDHFAHIVTIASTLLAAGRSSHVGPDDVAYAIAAAVADADLPNIGTDHPGTTEGSW